MRITRNRSRRGIAGIVATVIMFAILFTVGTSYFLFTSALNQKYIQSLISRQNSMNSIGSESLTVTTLLSGSHLEFYANNTGGIPVNATIVLVYSSTGTPLVCIGKSLPAGVCTTQSSTFSVCPSYSACTSGYVTPSYVIYTHGTDGSIVDTGYTYASGTITVKVITARGSTFTATYPSAVTQQIANQVNAQQALSIGSLLINQQSYRFYFDSAQAYGDGYIVSGYDAFTIPGSSKMVYSITLTDEDPNGRSVTLNQRSLLTLANNGVPSTTVYYIIGGISDSSPYTGGVALTAFSSTVTVAYKQTITVYFGASTPGGIGTVNTLSAGNPVGVFLLLYGQYSDNTYYSQTIPFEATYVTSANINSGGTTSGCAGSTFTYSLQSSTWSAGPHAYIVPVPSTGAGTDITSGTSTTSSVSFKIPAGTAVGYYQIFLSDVINQAYVTFHVTC